MKKKLKITKTHCGFLNKKRSGIPIKLFALIFFTPFIFLSGCAKTGLPQPPKIKPPRPPFILSAERLKNTVSIVYKYSGDIRNAKGFLLYRKYYKDKKSIKYICNAPKAFAFQNLTFRKKFSLQNGNFFYNVNVNNLKKGYYIFCAKSVGSYGVKSAYSNYAAVQIAELK